MSNVKVKAIQIELDGDTITVSIADAKNLWKQLNDFFEKKIVPDIPIHRSSNPDFPKMPFETNPPSVRFTS